MPGFVSQSGQNEIHIDDTNYFQFARDMVINNELKTRGLLERDWDKEPFGSLPFAAQFPRELLIPRNEWDDRIEQQEKDKSRISDLLDQAGLSVLDQNGTNYCWINAPVHCVEILQVIQNEPLVRLSPASCGGPIKNYKNVGGWGTEGLRYIVEHGIVPQNEWPPNAIKSSYDTPATRELRKKFQVYEWFDLRPRNEDELISCLLHNIPVAVGYNWWSHEVTAIDAVALGNGKYGIRINNSWGRNWGEKGRGILSGTRHLPDDACCPNTVTPRAAA